MTNKIRITLVAVLAVTLAISAVAATMPYADAKNSNPTVLPPTSKQYDKYTDKWWQWAYSIPNSISPVSDTTGEFCDVGQSGNVWFLAGTTGGTVERECNIPTGKTIVFPIINAAGTWPTVLPEGECVADNTGDVADWGSECYNPGLEGLMDFVEDSATLEVIVDGVPLQDLEKYRFAERDAFSIEPSSPELNAFGTPPEDIFSVHEGFFIALTPLTPGEHTIEFSAAISQIGFETGASYTVIVG